MPLRQGCDDNISSHQSGSRPAAEERWLTLRSDDLRGPEKTPTLPTIQTDEEQHQSRPGGDCWGGCRLRCDFITFVRCVNDSLSFAGVSVNPFPPPQIKCFSTPCSQHRFIIPRIHELCRSGFGKSSTTFSLPARSACRFGRGAGCMESSWKDASASKIGTSSFVT